MCVLLVEDEALIREIMAESLRDAGFEVLEASDGQQAKALIHDAVREFTIVVTDFHMPGDIDGLQVAAEARSVQPDIPVIIASGRPDVLKSAWTVELGYRLLRKPYLPSALVASVQTMLAII